MVDSEGVLSGAAVSRNGILKVVNARSTPTDPLECVVGETVNAFFVSVFVIGATGAALVGSVNWFISKIRAGQTVGDLPVPGEVGPSDIRNQVFHEEKGLAGSGDGTPMAFKGVIVVPKIYRRCRAGDEFHISLKSNDATVDATFCVKAIYKSFS